MSFTPRSTKEVFAKARTARWLARGWIVLMVFVCLFAAIPFSWNLNWTVTKGLAVVLVLLAYGLVVLYALARARIAVTLHARTHEMLVCLKDYTPTEAVDSTDDQCCPKCGVTIDRETLHDFWIDTLEIKATWWRWITSPKTMLAELPYDDPNNPRKRRLVDSDTIAAAISRARVHTWFSYMYGAGLLAIILFGHGWVPNWFGRTMLAQAIVFSLWYWLSTWAASRAQTRLLRYIREHGSRVCPKDFYPLVESDRDYQTFACPECGIETTAPECRVFWRQTLGNKTRWWVWLLLGRPRIN